MSDHPVRPQTPQAMLHRLPDKPETSAAEATRIPSKYIILILASTAVAGKAQIAKSVASAIGCPLFQGDSLHETAARAASVGATAAAGPRVDDENPASSSGANEGRYQRMWLSKMTRTGYLFPDESRPANEGFSGFGGGAPAPSSTSTSRRGSDSSVGSAASSSGVAGSSSSSYMSGPPPGTTKYINKPPPTTTLSADEKLRKANPALVVLTHPVLEQWHKDSIRHVVGEYGIGVIFIPLDEDDEPPVLKPLDPRMMTSFGSFGSFGNAQAAAKPKTLDEEIVLAVDTEANVEDLTDEIVNGVRDLMSATEREDGA